MEYQYLADSNVIIDYVGNKMPDGALQVLDRYFNKSLIISIISKIEVLGFDGEEQDLKQLSGFIALAKVINVDELVAEKTIELRKFYKIKTPDAIIAATAIVFDCTLLSRNAKDFKKINGLVCINPWEINLADL